MPSAFAEACKTASTERALSESRAIHLLGQRASVGGVDIAGMRDPAAGIMGGFGDSSRKNEAFALFRNWVYVFSDVIAKRLAGQPWQAGTLEGASPNPPRGQLPQFVKQSYDLRNLSVIVDHPVLDSLRRPNRIQKRFEFLYTSVISLLITGECYWIGGVVEGEDRIESWAVPTNMIEAKHEKGLYSEFNLVIGSKRLPINPENVVRTFFPHPSDLKRAWSPLYATVDPAHIDEFILSSQRQTFERGIFPNVIVTVSRERGPDGKLTDRRPVLQGHHRRQMISAIREIWNETVNAGDPAIVDGLIESIHPMHMKPQEMNWMTSGKQIKERISQAFGINPISVGEITGVNRAQAVEAERHLCRTVNAIGSALSETATDFYGPMFDVPRRLLVWIDPCVPIDADLELKKWVEAGRLNYVSKNEYRSNVLGITEDERAHRAAARDSVGGLTAALNALVQVGSGVVTAAHMARFFEVIYEIEKDQAEYLAGVDLAAEPDPPAAGGRPAAEGNGQVISEPSVDEAEILAALDGLEEKVSLQHERSADIARVLATSVRESLAAYHSKIRKQLTLASRELNSNAAELRTMIATAGDRQQLAEAIEKTAAAFAAAVSRISDAADKIEGPLAEMPDAQTQDGSADEMRTRVDADE